LPLVLTTFWFLERIANYRKKKRDLMNQVAAPKVSEKPQIDPITLEVIRHGIISICDQIDANMTRTAFSRIFTNIRITPSASSAPKANCSPSLPAACQCLSPTPSAWR